MKNKANKARFQYTRGGNIQLIIPMSKSPLHLETKEKLESMGFKTSLEYSGTYALLEIMGRQYLVLEAVLSIFPTLDLI